MGDILLKVNEDRCLTSVCSKTIHSVFSMFFSNTKQVVLSVGSLAVEVFKIHSKPAWFFRQAMNLVQSEPKLSIQISKSSFIVSPAAEEINRAVQSFLEHCPPPTVCCLVTIHFKGSSFVRVDGVNTAVSETSFVQLSAVSVYWKTMSSEAF